MNQTPGKNAVNSTVKALKRQIQVKLEAHQNINVELAELLGLSQESVYRRFREEVPFSFNEILKINSRYALDLDELFGTSNKTQVDFTPFYNSNFTLDGYLKGLNELLKALACSSPFKLYSLCSDIPMFRMFGYPVLSKFKMYYWYNLVEPSRSAKFYPEPGPVRAEIAEMFKVYSGLRVKEFWSMESVTGTLRQIEYFAVYKLIPDLQVILDLYTELLMMVEDLINNPTDSPNELYIYELSFNNNSFFVEGLDKRILAFGVNSINSIKTTDEILMNEYKDWLEVVKARSYKVTGQSYRLQTLFRKKTQERIFRSARDIMKESTFKKLIDNLPSDISANLDERVTEMQ